MLLELNIFQQSQGELFPREGPSRYRNREKKEKHIRICYDIIQQILQDQLMRTMVYAAGVTDQKVCEEVQKVSIRGSTEVR